MAWGIINLWYSFTQQEINIFLILHFIDKYYLVSLEYLYLSSLGFLSFSSSTFFLFFSFFFFLSFSFFFLRFIFNGWKYLTFFQLIFQTTGTILKPVEYYLLLYKRMPFPAFSMYSRYVQHALNMLFANRCSVFTLAITLTTWLSLKLWVY